MDRGVYFLADDRIIDLVVAFLNSFRTYNPSIPLCLIPFNSNIDHITQLQTKYHFQIYSDSEILNQCDELGSRISGKIGRAVRKLAAWHGSFEKFIYIDVDTIVLDNLDFVFEYLDHYAFISSHSNMSGLKKFVWKDSIDIAGFLSPEQIAYSANMGFIASKKGVLSLQILENKLTEVIAVSMHMEFYYQDQSLMNYLIVTSGRQYTSLFVLYFSYPGASNNIKLEQWAGQKGVMVKDGRLSFKKNHHPILLMHWAGEWQATSFDRKVYYLLKLFGFKKKTEDPVIRFFMPYKKLWKYYRYKN